MAIQYNSSLDRTFRALGDETRRIMVAQLAAHGVQSASELAAPFDASQPTLSKHLKVLETAGLVSREIEGRVHLFKLEAKPLEEVQNWVTRHKVFWQGTLDRLDSFLDESDTRANKK